MSEPEQALDHGAPERVPAMSREGAFIGASVRRREDPRLLTGAGRFVDDIDLTDDENAHLSSEQDKALAAAEHQIRLIGSDDDLLNHLDPSDEEHSDWFEFQLPLGDD